MIAAAGAKKLKRMNLELGGKTPMIVFDDAPLASTPPAFWPPALRPLPARTTCPFVTVNVIDPDGYRVEVFGEDLES